MRSSQNTQKTNFGEFLFHDVREWSLVSSVESHRVECKYAYPHRHQEHRQERTEQLTPLDDAPLRESQVSPDQQELKEENSC